MSRFAQGQTPGRGAGAIPTFALALALGASCLLWGTRARAEGEGAEHAAAVESAPAGGEVAAPEAPHLNGKKLALQLFNFSVLLIILVKAAGPAVKKALLVRHQQLKADLAASAAARAAAEARLSQQEARLGALEQEIAAIQQGVKQEAEAEKARLIAMAEERAQRIREETTFVLDQQIKEAEVRLRREVALAAVDVAEQMVRKSLGAADQQRMVDAFVADVGAPTTPGAPRGQA